jgi:hypothetical protein
MIKTATTPDLDSADREAICSTTTIAALLLRAKAGDTTLTARSEQ